MAEWEDEDFGGFESADPNTNIDQEKIGSSELKGTSPSSNGSLDQGSGQTGILSWILANSPKSPTDARPISSVQSTTSDENSKTPQFTSIEESNKAESQVHTNETETDAVPFQTRSWVIQGMTSGEGTTVSDNVTEYPPVATSHVESLLTNVDHLFASYDTTNIGHQQTLQISESGDAVELQLKSALGNGIISPPSRKSMESKQAIKSVIAHEPRFEKSVDDGAIQELQAKLDVAIITKEQTEKSLKLLQDEIISLNEKLNKDREDGKKRHAQEMDQLKRQHQEEMKDLQITSEETIKVISKQYTEVWKMLEKQLAIEAESSASSIVERCMKLMKQQQVTLSNKLEEDRLSQEKRTREDLDEEKKKMAVEIQERIAEEKTSLEKEMSNHLREELSKEIKRMEELHAETLREAMSKQQSHFEDVLQSTMQREREIFADTLKLAVEETRKSTEKSLNDRRLLEEKRSKNHTMALRMFLTSALEQVDRKLSDPSDEDQLPL